MPLRRAGLCIAVRTMVADVVPNADQLVRCHAMVADVVPNAAYNGHGDNRPLCTYA